MTAIAFRNKTLASSAMRKMEKTLVDESLAEKCYFKFRIYQIRILLPSHTICNSNRFMKSVIDLVFFLIIQMTRTEYRSNLFIFVSFFAIEVHWHRTRTSWVDELLLLFSRLFSNCHFTFLFFVHFTQHPFYVGATVSRGLQTVNVSSVVERNHVSRHQCVLLPLIFSKSFRKKYLRVIFNRFLICTGSVNAPQLLHNIFSYLSLSRLFRFVASTIVFIREIANLNFSANNAEKRESKRIALRKLTMVFLHLRLEFEQWPHAIFFVISFLRSTITGFSFAHIFYL